MNRRSILNGLVVALALFFGAEAQSAPQQELPAMRQAQLLARVLAYNRSLVTKGREAVVIVVLYKEGDSASEAGRAAVASALGDIFRAATLAGLPVKVKSVPYAKEIEASLDNATVVYLCPGLTQELSAITDAARKKSIFSATGTESYVRAGVSVGLVSRGPRPTMIVNLAAAKAENAELDSGLLSLAEIVK